MFSPHLTRRLSSSPHLTRRLSSSTSPYHPLRLTKTACFALLQTPTLTQIKQLHPQLIMSRLLTHSDITKRLMDHLTNPDTGDLAYAHKLLHTIPSPSRYLYNITIKAYVKNSLPDTVLSLFAAMRVAGLSPDNFTYPFVLKSIASLHIVSYGLKVHGIVVKSGFEFNPYVRNALMDMYAEIGCVQIARKLFDDLSVRDVVAWNVMIGLYVKCGKFDKAVEVFRMMEGEGVDPDEATLVSTLSACIRLGDLELGKAIHRYMDERLGFSVTASNALLDLYAKCGCLDMARMLFDGMPVKNVIAWTTMISGYAGSGMLEEARRLFSKSPSKDVILWTAMINGYVQKNRFEEALAVFSEMQMEGIKPDKFTIVSLLTVCANLGALEQGKWLHGYIEENRIQIDVVIATALIEMYAKCGSVEKSIEVFKRVGRKDTFIWTSAIRGLAMNGQTDKALELFKEMKRAGAEPDDIAFVGVLSACSHGGLVEEGRRHFKEMKELHHIEPKVEHYGCLVDLLGRAGLLDEAEKLIQCMPGVSDEDILPLFGSLLSACRIHGNVDMGERLAEKLLELEHGNSGIQTLIANIYAEAGRWDDETRIRRKMKDLAVKKTPGCSSIQVNGTIREFLVHDTSHPETKDIYLVLKDLSRVMASEVNDDLENRLMEEYA